MAGFRRIQHRWQPAATGVIVAMILAGCLGPNPSPSPSPTSTGTAQPTAPSTPSPSASPSGPAPTPTAGPPTALSWNPVGILPDYPSYGGTTSMTAVTPTWFGFEAVGYGPSGGRTWWSSDGGQTWNEALFAEPALRLARLQAVAASPTRIVAVGTIGGLADTAPGLWSSRDGVTWTAVKIGSETNGGYMSGVTWTGTEFIAVGRGDATSYDANIWRSPDGRTWTPQDIGDADPIGIVSGPAGTIAWGTMFEGPSTNYVWTIPATGPATGPIGIDQALTNVVATGGGFAGLEPANPSGYSVLRSPDGHAWQKVGSVAVASVGGFTARADGTLVAAGTTRDLVLETWESRDGAAWQPDIWPDLPEPGASILAAVATEQGVIGVGVTAGNRVGTWLAIPPDGSVPMSPERDPEYTGCPGAATVASPTALLADLYRLSLTKRATCFGATTLHLRGYLATPDGLGGTCGPQVATPAWLTGGCLGYPAGWLEGDALPFGSATALEVFGRGAVADALQSGHWVDIAGHFDDAASTTCRRSDSTTGALIEPAKTTIAYCRNHFVVTSVTWIKAPAQPTVNSDPAGIVNALPATFRLAPATGGWDNLSLPAGTTWGFRSITPANGAPVGAVVFRASTAASVPALAAALLPSIGPTTPQVIDGVTVNVGSGGLEAEFAVGLRVYDLGVDAGGTDSLRTVIQALIAAG